MRSYNLRSLSTKGTLQGRAGGNCAQGKLRMGHECTCNGGLLLQPLKYRTSRLCGEIEKRGAKDVSRRGCWAAAARGDASQQGLRRIFACLVDETASKPAPGCDYGDGKSVDGRDATGG